MTPTLARFVRLARNRIYGTVLSEQERADANQAELISEFKLFLAKRVQLDVRLELYSEESEWLYSPDGCSFQFAIDQHTFVLRQSERVCSLLLREGGEDLAVALIADDDQFEDSLLVAIDDAIRRRS
jgi:hypothetical protein